MDTGIHVLENVLTAEQCADYCKLYDYHAAGAEGRDYNGTPMVHYLHTRHNPVGREMLRIAGLLALDHVQRMFRVEHDAVEGIFLARLGEGHHHIPHYDNAKPDGSPNHTPQRTYSSLFYLNNDFTGGELVFPNHGMSVRPKAGLFVAFPSSPPYQHYVSPVRSGWRYSLPVWFTNRVDKMMVY